MFKSLKFVLPVIVAGASAQAQDVPSLNQLDFEPKCVGEDLVGIFSGCVMAPVGGIILYAPDRPPVRIPTIFAPSCFKVGVVDPNILPLMMQNFKSAGVAQEQINRVQPLAQSSFDDAALICGKPALGS